MDRPRWVLHPNKNFDARISVIKNEKAEDVPKVSIVIPSKDGYRDSYLPSLLEQMENQAFKDFELIIIVGDNRSGRAINTGVEIARGEILIILDDDIRLGHERIFQNLVEVVQNHPDIGMVGTSNLIPKDAPWIVRRAMYEIPRRNSRLVDKIVDSDMAEHPCCAIPKSIFYKIGGENELIPRGLDPYLRREIRKAGYRVVVIPNTWIHHLLPNSIFKIIKQHFRNGRQAAYCNKYYPEFVIDLASEHNIEVKEQLSFGFRIVRYIWRVFFAMFTFRWIYLATRISNAFGFAYGMLFSQKE